MVSGQTFVSLRSGKHVRVRVCSVFVAVTDMMKTTMGMGAFVSIQQVGGWGSGVFVRIEKTPMPVSKQSRHEPIFPHQCLPHRLSLCCAETPCTEQHGLQPHCQPARARLFARCLTPGEPLAYCLAHLGLFMSIATTQLTSDKVGAAHVTRCACTINCHATLMRFTSCL